MPFQILTGADIRLSAGALNSGMQVVVNGYSSIGTMFFQGLPTFLKISIILGVVFFLYEITMSGKFFGGKKSSGPTFTSKIS